ncbi:MAG: methionine--tRNA ligase [Gemmatimonadetes bacterium]|nr:methionine--tRNA ligase [Gemmatimonadota bacterium]
MDPNKPFYITTAIDYANGSPHLGHAVEKIGADVVARYHRRKGEKVHFVIGMDEHGQKVLQSAESAGVSPAEWVDSIAKEFVDAWEVLSISYDDFIRTTEDRHHLGVQEIIRRIEAKGDFYQGTYAGYYCVGCEGYKTEDELMKEEGQDLRCPTHPSLGIQWMEEENWFFRLSAYTEPLLELLEKRPEFVQPEIRRNEIRNVLKGGLEDISVSRSRLPWGVPWPEDPEHIVYVWLDALTNYLTAVGFPDEKYRDTWPADVHVIGKDITRFHCIYWPAFLLSAGLELPKTVWAHGFVTYGGQKLSKSSGVTFELQEAIERHGPDSLRYYLLREVPWNGDGDITRERFDERYTSELANDLGNLANRSLTMIEKYRGGVGPAAPSRSLDEHCRKAVDRYEEVMDDGLLHLGIHTTMDLVSQANGFIERQAPWSLAKDPAGGPELDATLASLARALLVAATLLHPFMPERMGELSRRLGASEVPTLDLALTLNLSGNSVIRGEPLFPRPDLKTKGV